MRISTLIEFNKILNPHKARLVRGPTGIGKSSIIKQIAESVGASVIDIRLPELEPTDLVGLPYLSDKGDVKVTRYAQPDWWPTETDKPIFLVMDEIDRANEDMQPIAMQICLDRKAGGRPLPNNVTVWAACNGERYMTAPMDQALIDRFAVVDLRPTAEEWIQWGTRKGINKSVLEFISHEKGRLDTPDKLVGQPNIVCPSRRSWAELGLTLNNIKVPLKEEERLAEFAKSFVGYSDAIAFTQWVKSKYRAVSPEHIMNGTVRPSDLNILQITSVIDKTVEIFTAKECSDSARKNCLEFFMSANNEVFSAFFSALPSDAGIIIERFAEADKFFKERKRALLNAG